MDNSQIHIRAEFIKDGKMEEYKKLIYEMIEFVEASEPDTLAYQFYFNMSETKCLVHETYADSESALAHNNSYASKTILPKILRLAKMNRIDIYGNPNEELQNVLTNIGAQVYNLFAGFNS